MKKEINNCPKCNASLIGKPIPTKHRIYYGNATHFKREIALYDRDLDKTVGFKCPDCEHRWPR